MNHSLENVEILFVGDEAGSTSLAKRVKAFLEHSGFTVEEDEDGDLRVESPAHTLAQQSESKAFATTTSGLDTASESEPSSR